MESPEPTSLPTSPRLDPQDGRRPRAQRRGRDVSSRYMSMMLGSPVSFQHHQLTSNSNNENCPPPPLPPPIPSKKQPHHLPKLHKIPSLHHHHQQPPNTRPSPLDSPTVGSAFGMETPLPLVAAQNKAPTTQTRRAVTRLFKENGQLQPRIPRPAIPITNPSAPALLSTPKPLPMARNQTQRRLPSHTCRNRTSMENSDHGSSSSENHSETSNITDFSDGEWCESPPLLRETGRNRLSTETRTSISKPNHHHPLPTRCSTDSRPRGTPNVRGGGNSSIVHRSLNSALSSCQVKPVLKPFPSPKPFSANPKQEMESKKIRKAISRREDTHTLRLLENRYFRWRFINAKAEVSAEARRKAAEKSLYGLSEKLLELRDSVSVKKIEIERAKQMKGLSAMLQTEMPLLEEWSNLEAEHSDNLSGTIKTLQDSSLRLPLIGNVKVDVEELSSVLGYARNAMETVFPCIGSFLDKADGVDNFMTDIATIVCKERSMIEECGNLLTQLQSLQVTECSLRSSFMQLNHNCLLESKEEMN